MIFRLTFLILSLCTFQNNIFTQNIELDTIREHLLALPHNAELSIGIVQQDSISFLGFRHVDSKVIPIDNADHVFAIGSITKTFTGHILAELILKKMLDPHQDLSSCMSIENDILKSITLTSLSNHTSGLPRIPPNLDIQSFLNPYETYSDAHLNDFLKTLQDSLKDNVYLYSNVGLGILGKCLSATTGKSYADLIRSLTLQYNMACTYIDEPTCNSNSVQGYTGFGLPTNYWDFASLQAAGAIRSNAIDMTRYIQAQLDTSNLITQYTQKASFTINESLQIGLGWHIMLEKNGSKTYWHNGGTGGFTSTCFFSKEHQTGLIILSNVGNNLNIDRLGRYIFDNLKR